MPHRKKRLIFVPRVGDCLESRVNLSASATNGLAAAIGALDDSSPPSTAVTPVERLDPYAVQRHAANVAIADAGKTDVVFFGDSITDFFETARGSPVWQREIAPLNAADFGVSADQTQHLLWRLQNGELDGHPKVAVVNIGTNNLAHNTTSETAAGVAAVVQQIEALSPKTKILLMGLFPRGALPTDPVRAEVQQVNALISGLADGDHIRYLDIGSDFLRPDGTLPDGLFYDSLHPSTAGYQVWADAILSPLAEMLGQPAPDPSHYGGPVLVDTPAALTVEASGPQGALVSFPMPLAFDGVDPHPAVTSTVPSGSVFPVGTTVVTFMATDSAGRTASTFLPITVRDTTSLGTSSPSTQVSLSGVSNVDGITNDNNTTVGNLDRAGDSYSADALGTTVTWGGATFNIGVATANNVVQMGGVPISLPQGNYSSIKLLGTGTYGVQPGT
ncbi:MAG TPA: GDSL-type esterase/lipase family protein, partial [Isosphaeraceae bacterium]|nr:GDSL-type esterase/lipase family protein [Isosphaeraceae bacterium]